MWTCTDGVQALEAGTPVPADPAARDPLQALDFILNCREPAIFLLKDFHPYLDDSRPTAATYQVIRKLRDLTRLFKESHKTVVLLSPVLRFPPELEKDITIVYYGFPSLDELDESLVRVINSVEKGSALRLGLDPQARERVLKAAASMTRAGPAGVRGICATPRSGLSPNSCRPSWPRTGASTSLKVACSSRLAPRPYYQTEQP